MTESNGNPPHIAIFGTNGRHIADYPLVNGSSSVILAEIAYLASKRPIVVVYYVAGFLVPAEIEVRP